MFTVPDVNPHAIGEVLANDVCGWALVVLVKIKESVFIGGAITRIFFVLSILDLYLIWRYILVKDGASAKKYGKDW